jgi:hypothetical protein
MSRHTLAKRGHATEPVESIRRFALGRISGEPGLKWESVHTFGVHKVPFHGEYFGTSAIEPGSGGDLQSMACRTDQTEEPQPPR